MRFRLQPWQWAALLLLACAAAAGILVWRSTRQPYTASRLVQMLPANGAVKVFVDVAKLRQSGILDQIAGQKTAEDADYRRLVEQIGFDYRTDLDQAAAAFVNGAIYLAVTGRFDWKRLTDYAQAQQGTCENGVCSMPGGQAGRFTSFYRMDGGVMGLAFSDQPEAVKMIRPGASNGISVPASVVWISAPGPAFKDPQDALPGTRSFLTPLAQSKEASFSIGPATSGADSAFEIRMNVTCASPESASQLAANLTTTTDVLRGMIVSDKLAPDKGSLTRVLVAGRFEAHAATVAGTWPLDRQVIQALATGQVR